MFSTLPETNYNYSVTLNLSSANSVNLDRSRILSFRKGLIPYSTNVAQVSEFWIVYDREKHTLERGVNANYQQCFRKAFSFGIIKELIHADQMNLIFLSFYFQMYFSSHQGSEPANKIRAEAKSYIPYRQLYMDDRFCIQHSFSTNPGK